MITVVTDSGAQMSAELIERLAVGVVPLTIVVDGVGQLEGSQIGVPGITEALRRGAAVSTSTASPGQFLAAYERAAERGASEVLSIHTGGTLSGTANAARLGAQMSPIPVEVVDTGTASFPVTLCVWAAVQALENSGGLADAVQAVQGTAASMGNVFIVGTLALAARSGRLAPGVDPSGIPVLAFTGTLIEAIGKVNDVTQAVDAMGDYVVAQARGQRIRIGVGHLAAPDLADALQEAISERVDVEQLVRYDIGPSIAAHTGLGTVGCVFHPVGLS